jgi:hypothetical protein
VGDYWKGGRNARNFVPDDEPVSSGQAVDDSINSVWFRNPEPYISPPIEEETPWLM